MGFDIDVASRRLDLSTLETRALPVQVYRAGLGLGGYRPALLWRVAADATYELKRIDADYFRRMSRGSDNVIRTRLSVR